MLGVECLAFPELIHNDNIKVYEYISMMFPPFFQGQTTFVPVCFPG